MLQNFIHLFSYFSPEVATFLMAMTPVGELRLSIPIGILAYKLPIWKVFILSVIGNSIPPLVILIFAGKFHEWVHKRSGFFSAKWIKALNRAQEKFSSDYKKYGLIGLMIFVGIPIPWTGAYTGALAAFVFGIPLKSAWPYFLAGISIAATITTLITIATGKIF